MVITARFFVQSITRHAHDPAAAQVKLCASSRGEENKRWATATPAGQIEMTIKSQAAAQWFVDRLGQDVALRFEEIEPVTHRLPSQVPGR